MKVTQVVATRLSVALTDRFWMSLAPIGGMRPQVDNLLVEIHTDAGIVGALAGTALGIQSIPIDWLRGLFEWPHSVTSMRELATRLAESRWPSETPPPPQPHRWPGVFGRNMLFLGVVLAHGGRRLLTPR